MSEENKNLEAETPIEEKMQKISSDESFWNDMHHVYDEVEVPKEKYESDSIDEDILFDEEEKKEPARESIKDEQVVPQYKEKTTLHDILDTKTAVSTFDTVMSTLGSMTYNLFAKDHKCSPKDWALTQAQANGLMPVTEALLKHIEVKSESPYLAFCGVVIAIYGSKAQQIRSHYRQGTDLGKEATYSGSSRSSKTGKNYVKKWIGSKSEGNPNPEHEHWINNPEEFAKYNSN